MVVRHIIVLAYMHILAKETSAKTSAVPRSRVPSGSQEATNVGLCCFSVRENNFLTVPSIKIPYIDIVVGLQHPNCHNFNVCHMVSSVP